MRVASWNLTRAQVLPQAWLPAPGCAPSSLPSPGAPCPPYPLLVLPALPTLSWCSLPSLPSPGALPCREQTVLFLRLREEILEPCLSILLSPGFEDR